MHRVSGHRESGLRSRRTLLFLAPTVVVAVVGVVLGRSLMDSSETKLTSAPSSVITEEELTPDTYAAPDTTTTTAPAPRAAAKTRVVPVSLPSLGVRKGVITLRGPAKAAAGARIVFVLDGAKRLKRTDTKAPFAVKVNTRALPNGRYTLTVRSVVRGKSTVLSTRSLRIKNTTPPKQTVKPKPKPSSSATKPPSSGGGSGGGSETAPPSSGSGFAAEILALTNAERKAAGCNQPLKLNTKLNKAAQAHSTDMATNNYFEHNSQDGRNPFDRIKAAGYSFSTAAENIAAGNTSAAKTMDQWMNSAGHKANILNCDFRDLGVGYAKGTNATYSGYWTQNFGAQL
jgi:uncharacterized protein YkwD